MKTLRVLVTRRIALVVTATISIYSQAATPTSWRTECVGRTLLSLPPDVELAGVPHKGFAKELVPGGGAMLTGAQFSDGQITGWNRILYVNGDLWSWLARA